jgi:hypothetical protein
MRLETRRLAIAGALLLLACTTRPPNESRPTPRTPTLASAQPSPEPDPEPTATATPPEPPPDSPDAAARRPRTSHSPGKIECHDVVCDLATELCCTDNFTSGRCIPRTAPAGCDSLELLWKYCDELGDCAPGHVCCYSPRPDPSVHAQNVCRKGDCTDPEHETCLAGGKCSRKRSCNLVDPDASSGYCH